MLALAQNISTKANQGTFFSLFFNVFMLPRTFREHLKVTFL